MSEFEELYELSEQKLVSTQEQLYILRKALAYADDRYDPVYPDFYILQAAADLLEDEEPALASEIREFRSRLIDALDQVD